MKSKSNSKSRRNNGRAEEGKVSDYNEVDEFGTSQSSSSSELKNDSSDDFEDEFENKNSI